MEGITHLFLLILLYGFICFVPVAINYNRRKSGLPAYWMLFLVTILIELAIVYAMLFIILGNKENMLSLYAPPIIASIIAGAFYFYVAKKYDEKHS